MPGLAPDDVAGTGSRQVTTLGVPVQAALWMNHLDYWDSWGPDNTGWVFAHEMGHQWLSFARFLDGVGDTSWALLGRQTAHWSYFMDTGNSPMEGNAWVDNDDGTFTTDLDVEPAFSDLDLYMMGLLEADHVEDFFLLTDVAASSRQPESNPEHLWYEEPVTVEATRVEVGIDDIVAVHGPRSPGPEASQRDFRLLMVLVVNATESVEQSVVDRAYERQAQWVAAWDHFLEGASTVSFSVTDEGFSPPAWSETPLVPKAAR